MARNLGEFAYEVKPHLHRASAYYAQMPNKQSLKATFGGNISAVRTARKLSQPAVAIAAKRAGFEVGQTTVGRIERAVHAADIDTIEAISKGLGVEAWQLLLQGFDPAKPPQLGSNLAKDEQQLLDDYRAASDGWKLTMRLMARTPPEEQPKLSHDMNLLMTTIFDNGAASDASVAKAYGPTPGKKPPTLHDSADPKAQPRKT